MLVIVGRVVGAGVVRLVPDELDRLLPPNRLLPERLDELPVERLDDPLEREPLPVEEREVDPRLWEAELVDGLAEGREPLELLDTRLPWRCMGSA